MKILIILLLKNKMKRIVFIACGLALIGIGCKKSTTNNPSTTTTTTNNFSYKLDGTAMTIDSAKATLYTLGLAPYNRMIDVFAFKGGLEVLEFHFKPVTGSSIADGTFANSWLTYKSGINFPNDYFNSTSGSLNITLCDTINKKIEGTFNFVGNNGTTNKNITDGVLKVDITSVQ
jgi:hypothetical protein